MPRGRLIARDVGGRTELAVSRASSPLRLLRSSFAGERAASVCVVVLGAGLVDGDAIELDVEVEPGATLLLFTQASTKVFRGHASQRLDARVAGTLVLLPDPVAAFAGARFEQRIDVALEGGASRCVLLDGYTAGRPAFGQRWDFDRLELSTTIRRGGRTVLHDAVRLAAGERSIADRMRQFEAFLTLVSLGAPPVSERLRGSDHVAADLVVAASVRDDLAIARIAATSTERALDAARLRLTGLNELGVVDPFSARN